MSIERTMKLVCNGDPLDPKCEGAAMSVHQYSITANRYRNNMAGVGWTRAGMKDFCQHCSTKRSGAHG